MIIAVVVAASAVMLYRPLDIQARYQGERLRADVRHMQMLALTRGTPLRFCGNAGNYFVTTVPTACATNAPVTDPVTSANFSVVLDTGITLAPAPSTFDFDSLGRPADCISATNCPLRAGNTTINVQGGGAVYNLNVRPLTGFASI